MVVTPGPALPTREPQRWCIGFTDVDPSDHWLRRLLNWLPHPRHVNAFRDTPAGLLLVEHTLSRLTVNIHPQATEASYTAEIEAAGGHVVVVTVPAEDGGWTPRLGNCITTTRALLAMRPRPQTARGLLHHLRGRR